MENDICKLQQSSTTSISRGVGTTTHLSIEPCQQTHKLKEHESMWSVCFKFMQSVVFLMVLFFFFKLCKQLKKICTSEMPKFKVVRSK